MSTIGLITKAIIGAAVTASSAVIAALLDGYVDTSEWIAIAIAFFGGLYLVWQVPNLSAGVLKYGKALTTAVLAGLSAAATALIGGGIGPDDWAVIITAVIVGSGLVGIAPNAAVSDSPPQG